MARDGGDRWLSLARARHATVHAISIPDVALILLDLVSRQKRAKPFLERHRPMMGFLLLDVEAHLFGSRAAKASSTSEQTGSASDHRPLLALAKPV